MGKLRLKEVKQLGLGLYGGAGATGRILPEASTFWGHQK